MWGFKKKKNTEAKTKIDSSRSVGSDWPHKKRRGGVGGGWGGG